MRSFSSQHSGCPGADSEATITVCVPAHNEAATLGGVLTAIREGTRTPMQLLVVDDGSEDGTGEVARRAGAEVIAAEGSWRGRAAGKGAAMTTGLQNSVSDIVVFLDADVTDLRSDTLALLTEPLLRNSSLVMTKATYDRALNGAPHEGGRVNALLARPLLRRCFPELGDLTQPLAGEYAVRREQLTGIRLEPGYGVEVGLLIDIASRYGADAIAEVDLATRTHRNRPLRELTGHADAIVAAILDRYSAENAALRPHPRQAGVFAAQGSNRLNRSRLA